MENNKMVSFGEIIEGCFRKHYVYIPLIQRNYKWDANTAAKLASDLWNAYKEKQEQYTMGMITLFQEENEEKDRIAAISKDEKKQKIQLIDGQQRTITLFLLLKYLTGKNYFSFGFERDEGVEDGELKRKDYLEGSYLTLNASDQPENNTELYTDLARFRDNYLEIKKAIEKEKSRQKENGFSGEPDEDKKFAEYITEKVYFLLHISETEPFDEFMNLNKNKTRFVISDQIKAHLIMDAKVKEERTKVLTLFRELSEMLFSKKDVWGLVSQGYCEKGIPQKDERRKKIKLYPDENRLKLLCCERYGSDEFDGGNILGYEYQKEFETLSLYRDILTTLADDIKHNQWNSYNGFLCFYQLKKNKKTQEKEKPENTQDKENEFRFFLMLQTELKHRQEEYTEIVLEDYLLEEYINLSKDNEDELFEKACFIESQLANEKHPLDILKDDDKNTFFREDIQQEFQENMQVSGDFPISWRYIGKRELELFNQIYIAYRKEKYEEKN